MYSLTIVLEPVAGREAEVLEACLATVEPSRAEPGCLFFDVLVGVSSQGRTELVFYEAYVDEGAFQAHLEAPHVRAWQERALPNIERSTIRLPAHRGRTESPLDGRRAEPSRARV
jgi:quinol monooxygenase YgiN